MQSRCIAQYCTCTFVGVRCGCAVCNSSNAVWISCLRVVSSWLQGTAQQQFQGIFIISPRFSPNSKVAALASSETRDTPQRGAVRTKPNFNLFRSHVISLSLTIHTCENIHLLPLTKPWRAQRLRGPGKDPQASGALRAGWGGDGLFSCSRGLK